MIDLDIILEASEEKRGTKMWLECGNLSYCDINELILRIRQAEKDAARYRWLRESASTEDHGGFAYSFRVVDAIRYMPGASPNETMDIDDAIDEAMKCNK